jgi:hypothetical protein
MSYRIDGVLITPTMIRADGTGGAIGLIGTATSPYSYLAITLSAPGPGTYTVGPSPAVNPSSPVVALALTSPLGQWLAENRTGSGSITFTTLNATGMTGTFTFTLDSAPYGSGLGTRAITDGVFNVRF